MKDGGPAFPCEKADFETGPDNIRVMVDRRLPGMSLRDWFAGMALQGLMSVQSLDLHDEDKVSFRPIRYAEWAYEQADMMLKEREVEHENEDEQMKVKLQNYGHASNGFSLQLYPETAIEHELLRGLFRHGKLETGHPSKAEGGLGFYISWKMKQCADPKPE